MKKGHNSHNKGRILPLIELDLYFMIIYLCIKYESNTLFYYFSTLKKGHNSQNGGFYPKSNLTYILWLYTCV